MSADGTTKLFHRIGDSICGEPSTERRNPARKSEVVAVSPAGDRALLEHAVDVAEEAQRGWAALPAPERGAVLLRAASLLARRKEKIAADLVREEGKTKAEASSEVERAVELLYFYGGEGRRGRAEITPSGTAHTLAYTRREPLGVVGVITPWNFPIAIPTWKCAPALVAGNSVILKPAELTPLSAWHLAAALSDAGLPPGVLNLVYGSGSVVGAAIAAEARISAVSFTGSNEVGRRIEATVGARHARVQLEMGGKNPLVVLDDADPAFAAHLAAVGAFGLTGQACTATSRIICTPGIRDRFLGALIEEARRYVPGDGMDPHTLMGPVVSDEQLETDLSWIDVAKSDGATTVTPLVRTGSLLSPVVLTDLEPTSSVAQEEVFGPVVSIFTADGFDDALTLANTTKFGLSAAVVTRDLRAARRFIDEARAGVVKVNRPTGGVEPNMPFGGVKESSTNTYREQGSGALDFYTWTKSVYLGMND